MQREKFLKILKEMDTICKSVNETIIKENPENKLRYEVLQFSNISRKWNSVHEIANFYNYNWRGNVDFMHIPNFKQVLENCLNYPIIIAREKENNEILAISTVKYDENNMEHTDPYFPEKDAKYFSITGVLVKKENTHKGMGKKIYEIAIRSAYEYNKTYPGTRIMCVIDCRNRHSLRALSSAVDNINNNELYGKNKELPANIVGYYELQNPENSNLKEAPTLVLEVGLEERDKQNNRKPMTFEYKKQENQTLFETLKKELREKIKLYGINKPVVAQDSDGMVYYYSLDKECRLVGTEVISNGTELGNDRKPFYDEYMQNFIGPIQPINIENGKKENER